MINKNHNDYKKIEYKRHSGEAQTGFNDLAALYPEIAAEWDYNKNGDLTPSTVAARSNKKVWWICKNGGHNWAASIYHRTSGSGCPFCSGRNAIPGETDLATLFPDVAKEWDHQKNGEITPDMVTAHSGKKFWWICEKGHQWTAPAQSRTAGFGCPFCSGRNAIPGKTDLATLFPNIAKEWDHQKNGEITPDMVTAHSGKKFWWICEKGHQWKTAISNRTKGRRCPYCSRQNAIPGKTDLATLFPNIAKEWDHQKNGEITPDMVTAHSGKKFWWICEKGHQWKAAISNRTKGNRCPYCSGRKTLPGETDLATLLPDVAKEWNYEKNEDFTPDMFTAHSGKKFWWICEKGHQWKAAICDRANGQRCPYCCGRKAIPGETDLATLLPDVAKEWNYEKNGELTPDMVAVQSNKKVWWICERKHQWEAVISSRTTGCRCPFCTGRSSIPGETDLATLFPDVAKEWDYEKNGNLTPDTVTAHSGKKVWWICERNHQWEATIISRTNGSKCPYCSGHKAIPGKTDLATLFPAVASEWNYELNGELTPDMFTARSSKKVWWLCEKKHQWEAVIRSRTIDSTRCPICNGCRKNTQSHS